MEIFDVAIVGGGPAGSSCAAFCAMAGLETLVLERARFPREKVCGDCLNPSCWRVLERLDLTQRVLGLPHSKLTSVEFIAIDGRKVSVDLPTGNPPEAGEISVKRSLFDDLLFKRARELGAQVREDTTVTALVHDQAWKIETATRESFRSRILIGADGRNSTVARLRNLLPHPSRERVALQAHIPLPLNFDERVVLQFLREGYSGQAPVNENELNLCLVGKPSTISRLRQWAQHQFEIPANQRWRTITPLTRTAVPCAHEDLLVIGDAARVVEPFTGEGIYYALHSGELAARAVVKIVSGEDRQPALREFTRASAEMCRGRLWINRLARAAVLSPRVASFLIQAARPQSLLGSLTGRIVSASPR